MSILSININGAFLDLYDDEKIVQSFTIINIEDVTKRTGEYSNNFKIPRTTNNTSILRYSDYVNNTDRLPYERINCDIYINDFLFKRGFIQLNDVNDDFELRFFTGNVSFYESLKGKLLTDVSVENTPSLLITWSLFSVVASRALTSGAFFPLIDYNGMGSTGDVVDVRRLLPAYYKHTLMEAIAVDAGYTIVNEITGTTLDAYEHDIIPTSKNNLETDPATVDDNSYIGDMLTGTNDVTFRMGLDYDAFNAYGTSQLDSGLLYHSFSTLQSGNANNYFPQLNGQDYFTCNLQGNYEISYDLNVFAEFNNSWSSTPVYEWNSYCYIDVYKNGIQVQRCGTLNVYTASGQNQPQITANDNIAGSFNINLNFGDRIRLTSYCQTFIHVGNFQGGPIYLTHFTDVRMSNNDFFGATLSSDLIFGSQVFPGQCLPKIEQAKFFKDTCIRYGIIPIINEDLKTVTLKQFGDLKKNIPNAVDWSDKIDETKTPNLSFMYGDYARRNNVKHLEDKFEPNPPFGSDGVISIDNYNLEPEKDLYVSPFAASTNVLRLDTSSLVFIDLHDGTDFKNDVKPRCCFVRLVTRNIDYYDGTTTTTATTQIPETWFIDTARDYSAGFGIDLLTAHSIELVAVLQGLKKLNIDIRLNLLDILNLNYFYPVYINKYNAYFFINIINQFDYTSTESTDVELIKLN